MSLLEVHQRLDNSSTIHSIHTFWSLWIPTSLIYSLDSQFLHQIHNFILYFSIMNQIFLVVVFLLQILHSLSHDCIDTHTSSLLNIKINKTRSKKSRIGVSRSVETIISSDKKIIDDSTNTGLFTSIDKKTNKRVLNYYGLMLGVYCIHVTRYSWSFVGPAGAVARSIAATAVHPLNVIKTMLQTKGGKMPAWTWAVLSRGAGSQFIMSVPHGAINFAVTEVHTSSPSFQIIWKLHYF